MAVVLTDTGVTLKKGGVKLDLSFAQLERWAKRMKIDTPRLTARSFGRACSGLKKQLVQVMERGGGIHGVPAFKDYEPFTKELRRNANQDPTGPIGGILAEKYRIVAFKRNGAQIVGWPDKMENLSEAFQEGRGGSRAEAYFEDKDLRRIMHRRAASAEVPRSYVHNPRQVLEPHFREHVAANLIKWAKGAYYKELGRLMLKGAA